MSRYIRGVHLMQGLLPAERVAEWAACVPARERAADPFNPVAVEIPVDSPLREIARYTSMVGAMREVLGADWPWVYNERVVMKDRHAREAVFLHQDCVYHQGFLNKWSAFVALSEVTPENGGLVVYPFTCNFGSLGDAGEIDRRLLEGREAYCPTMAPGDVLFMHSATWHESGPYTGGPDRILVDIIFQPSGDPRGIDRPLVRSRVSRIRELEAQLAAVRADLKALRSEVE